jgi:aspartate carbamoyltransferase catalytic subunit
MTPEVYSSPRSLILDQVTNGVAVRMAILTLLVGKPGETPFGS